MARSASSATTTSVMFACVTASWPRTLPRRNAAVLWGQPGVTTVRLTPAPSQAQVGLWPHHARQDQCSAFLLHLGCTNRLFSLLPISPWHLPPGQWSTKRSALSGKAIFPRKIHSQEKSLSQVLSFTLGERGREWCKALPGDASTEISVDVLGL